MAWQRCHRWSAKVCPFLPISHQSLYIICMRFQYFFFKEKEFPLLPFTCLFSGVQAHFLFVWLLWPSKSWAYHLLCIGKLMKLVSLIVSVSWLVPILKKEELGSMSWSWIIIGHPSACWKTIHFPFSFKNHFCLSLIGLFSKYLTNSWWCSWLDFYFLISYEQGLYTSC